MKARVDLSNSNRFTVWESGGWAEAKGFGSAVIVAGPQGEKLPVIYDVNPQQNVHQCCFMAEIGNILCESYIKKADQPVDGKDLILSLELARIDTVTTALVQGVAQPRLTLKTLWVHREMATRATAMQVAESYTQDTEFYRDEYLNLVKLAIEKSLLPGPKQRFFWAIERS